MSTRAGGVSAPPFDSLNLRPSGLRADAVDDPSAIAENQRRWAAVMAPARPVWLDQVHGARVVRLGLADLNDASGPFHQADAAVTTERGVACTVLVADCLPVLLADRRGRAVGAAHAGWRGLAGGVLEATVAELCDAAEGTPAGLQAWLGACIGPNAFEVGADVRDAFGPAAQAHFRPTGQAGKWWADLPSLARQRLAAAGVTLVSGGRWCTASNASRFFSFRRDRVTGRHAASVWLV
ncbi:peptidoglycan editing factor PgeF [Ideonella sp. 4Y11]|uniref:Purine nucleoside phosphorylase n=2 Tax=Ideonella aquatica TaxID=2824119 RepID=A0A940YI93_9BURK|nr:peptidoglycan editing factor PgeF [Ideonella aquatica]